MIKRKLVNKFVDITEAWNKELHGTIEKRVQAEYLKCFPEGRESIDDMLKTMNGMREFYHQRMTVTASLLIASTSMLVAVLALIFSLVSLFK
ncbi:hypothetical protein JBO49_27970 [Serratia fonticola]|uniref:hypothetical protein n=1 Tax=Serratia fonticola TaxID=47917 RepID=UPI00192B8230|nr:hypothetical protein [Serratia fonticola]MBL5864439.1 hypothetical protein [Serratia fonticola]